MIHRRWRLFVSIPLVGIALLRNHPLLMADENRATPLQTQPQPSYQWSETSDTVRLPKTMITNVILWGVAMTNYETARTYVLSKEFIAAFLVTENEALRVNRALADALHRYRTVEANHLQLTTNVPRQSMQWARGPAAVEEVHFELQPFPKEAATIRWELQNEILGTLGKQRAQFFWEYSFKLLQSVMDIFTREEPAVLGARPLALSSGNQSRNAPAEPSPKDPPLAHPKTRVFHNFYLRNSPPYPEVEMLVSRWTEIGRGGGGGGGGGGPLSEGLDTYVPEVFKPTLARWRQAISEGTVPGALGLKASPRPALSSKDLEQRERMGEPVAPPVGDPVFTHVPWDELSGFVELSKARLAELRIQTLTLEGELAPEAAQLYALSADEHRSVTGLFREMDERMKMLELAHFDRVGITGRTLILRAFPDEKGELEQEWLRRLGKLVGPTRARILDLSMKRPPPMEIRRGHDMELGMQLQEAGPCWLGRGSSSLEFNIEGNPGGRWYVRYRSTGGDGKSGSFSGNWGHQPPQQFRHLLTREVLESKFRATELLNEGK